MGVHRRLALRWAYGVEKTRNFAGLTVSSPTPKAYGKNKTKIVNGYSLLFPSVYRAYQKIV